MSESLHFDYFYGAEAEKFKFYRIPKILITDSRFSKLNSDAKLAYGLMLDRMTLSIENKWFDDQSRAYIIYTLANITADLNCSPDKATRIFNSLQSIGLIERVRRGLGKPDIIYVKNFASIIAVEEKSEADNDDPENSSSARKEPAKSEKTTESLNCGIKTPQINDSKSGKKMNLDSAKQASINTNNNNTKDNDTDLISLSSTTPDEGQIEQYKAKIAQNIRLDWLLDAAHMQGADEVVY